MRSLDILACAKITGGNLSGYVDSRVGATGEGNHTARGPQDLNAEPLHGLGRRDGGLARSAASLLLGRGRQPLEGMRRYLFPSRCLVGRESSFD